MNPVDNFYYNLNTSNSFIYITLKLISGTNEIKSSEKTN